MDELRIPENRPPDLVDVSQMTKRVLAMVLGGKPKEVRNESEPASDEPRDQPSV